MNWKIITPAAATPVALADAKKHLKVSGTAEDDLITLYLQAATEMAESYLGIRLINTVIEEMYEEFSEISFLRFPAQTITSIKYDADDDTEKTVSTSIYTLNTYTEPQIILRNVGEEWPIDLADKNNRIRVRYTAGFGSAPSSVPANIRAAILIILGELYENREDRVSALPKASHRLLEPWRICRF
jgi:uncharacterized phiE125 gp8 family phage protein